MSDNKDNNPCTFGGETIIGPEGELTMPPENSRIGVSASDVRGTENRMKLASASSHTIVMIDGKPCRVGRDNKIITEVTPETWKNILEHRHKSKKHGSTER